METPFDVESELDDLRQAELYRTLRPVSGRQGRRMVVNGCDVLMFAGANYLDLAGDSRVVQAAKDAVGEFGCAAGGARLISGTLTLHEELEGALARFVGSEAALLFSTGYMANVGVMTALAKAGDVIVSDSLNHASTIDGARLSGAEKRIFRHNDPADLERIAAGLSGFRRRILVVDGVYSMDGDVARLREFVPIARRHEMMIVVDDAHGLGVLGENGRGAVEAENVEVDLQIGNLGKALGSFGAYVACSSVLREFLINTARPFIFTCSLPPAAVGAARVALDILAAEPERRQTVLERATQLRNGLRALGYDTGVGTTHILPLIVGDNARAVNLCESVLERGVYAQVIRFPSVPEGAARLRFTPIASHTMKDVETVVGALTGLSGDIARARPKPTAKADREGGFRAQSVGNRSRPEV